MWKLKRQKFVSSAVLLCCLSVIFPTVPALVALAQYQMPTGNLKLVTIVIPPKIVAGELATLATLGPDGKLVPHVTVHFGNGEHVETDTTGRAVFTAPKTGGVLIARASGDSVAALIDPADGQSATATLEVSPVISVRDRFPICGGGFQGDAEHNRVQINGDFALVLAASPECLVVAAGPSTLAGPATVSVKTSTGRKEAAAALVSFNFEPPKPALTIGARGWLTLRVTGCEKKLIVGAENETPGVIHFEKGDRQEVVTSGGATNKSEIRVQAVSSGDFSFRARLRSEPDPDLARRFLQAAEPLATPDVQRNLKKLASQLARHPRDAAKVRSQLEQITSVTMEGDLRTVLAAADAALE